MHTDLQNLYRQGICPLKDTLTVVFWVKIFSSRIWKVRYTKTFVSIYVLTAQRDTLTIQQTVWIFLHNVDSALQIVFAIVVYESAPGTILHTSVPRRNSSRVISSPSSTKHQATSWCCYWLYLRWWWCHPV